MECLGLKVGGIHLAVRLHPECFLSAVRLISRLRIDATVYYFVEQRLEPMHRAGQCAVRRLPHERQQRREVGLERG